MTREKNEAGGRRTEEKVGRRRRRRRRRRKRVFQHDKSRNQGIKNISWVGLGLNYPPDMIVSFRGLNKNRCNIESIYSCASLSLSLSFFLPNDDNGRELVLFCLFPSLFSSDCSLFVCFGRVPCCVNWFFVLLSMFFLTLLLFRWSSIRNDSREKKKNDHVLLFVWFKFAYAPHPHMMISRADSVRHFIRF